MGGAGGYPKYQTIIFQQQAPTSAPQMIDLSMTVYRRPPCPWYWPRAARKKERHKVEKGRPHDRKARRKHARRNDRRDELAESLKPFKKSKK